MTSVQTTVTARHCEIPDDLRERALDNAAKLAKIAHRPTRMEILFDHDNNRRSVELKMWMPRGHILVAVGEAADFKTALDRAVEKLRAQLDKDDVRPARRKRQSIS
jgi:ribosomal subunit interface protein